LDLGNVAAHVYAEFESENLECDRLNQAFQRLIDRHDMLRTVVLSQGEQQVLETVPPYTIDRVDLRQMPAAEVERQLMALRHQLSHQIHEADQWPLFTVRAAQLEGQRLRLFLSFDNLLVDGASLGLLCWEWGQLYQDLDTPLTPLNLSFREYVLALKGFEQSEVYLRSLTYWQQRLADLPLAPDLPLATAPAALTQPRFSRLTTQIEAPTWQRLQKQAQTAGLTPSGLLVAAYAEILATWSKHRRFSLNLTTFNRLPIHPQVQAIVGDFTSLTLLAVDYSTPGSFWQRAQQLQHQLWQDLEHSYVSGVRVLRELARSPESATRVTMPVVFTSLLANPQLKRESAFGTDWLGQRVYSIAQTPQVWLDHQVYEETGALVLNWDAVQGLFPAGMVEAMFDAYVQLLETLAEQPDIGEQTRIASLPEQQRARLSEFNATVTTLSDQCLHTLFLTQAEQQPQHLAVVAGSVQLTYADLLVRSQQLAQHLQSLNVKPNQLIAITLEKGWEQVVAVLGVLMSGAAYVPIDPALPQARRWHLLEQSTEPGNAAIVLTHSGLQTTLDWPEQSHTLAIDTADLPPVTDGLLVPQQPTDLAYVIYTSGSTGLPKGVMVDHRGAVNTILDINRRWEVGPCDRVFALSSLSFDLSVYDIFGTLAAGGTLVIPPTSAAKDPALWSEILLREQVTLWNSVPALMQMLVTYAAGRPDILPSSLRLVLLSGDWLPLSLPDQIRALVPDAQVVSLGGATEASIWSIFHNIEAIDPTWTSIPYGRPLANQQFYVLDAELETCPVWVPGQLYIGGAGLAKGYWRDQTKTAASFVTHPHTGKTLYRTGDLGRYRPSGQIEFLGREDTQVKIGGHRIELGEIETALEQHPEVAQGVVLTIGDSAQQLVAQVCLADNSTETARQLTSGQIPTISAWHHSSAESANSWQAMLSATLSQTAQIAEPGDWETFKTFWQHLQDLYQVAIGRVLSQTGAFTQPGDRHSWNSLQQSLQIHPRYHPWLRRALNQLIEQGYLQEQQAEYIQVLPLPESLPAELVQQLMTEANQAIGLDAAATRLLIEIVENLTDILTENQHSAEIYAAEAIPEVYQKQFHTSNLALQHAIASLAKIWQPEGPLRVLEVGAGIGSTTHYVLPMLPADRTTYVFTDLSNYFLQSAQQTFAAYPFLETRLLNLEQPPQTQDYELHSFDVVIASSVLHATRDIAETLNHIVLLLKPGGVLLLLEETQFQAPFDLTMGLQQGFDRFEDTALRQQHPLLSQDQWQQVLLTAGFTACEVLSQPDTIAEWLGFDVFIAQAPTPVRVFQPDNLKRYLSQKLPAYMVPQHYMALEAMPLTTNGKIDRRSLQALWTVTPSVESDYVAPQNAIQARVVEIWQALLSRDRIGIEDNFFELGGDSLIATQVVARVQDSFQVDVPLRHLFQAPTIAQLAAAIVQALAAQVDPDLIANLEAESEFNRLEPLNPEPLQLEGESFHG
ncbi:MAG: amino acid adenylation domain-containing protein, partial [Cyanobacteria bacterium P01_G01_bin.38]